MSEDRILWLRMLYACNRACGFTTMFLLEEGLEGPRDEKRPPPEELVKRWEGAWWRTPDWKQPDEIYFTASGRIVLPVPFMSAKCPDCGGDVIHVNWREDVELEPRVNASDCENSYFAYPNDPMMEGACGEPVLRHPWRAH